MKQRKQLFQYVDSENPPKLHDLAGLKAPESNGFWGNLCESDHLAHGFCPVQDIKRIIDIFDVDSAFDQLINW